jgi:hypothetical protein
MNVIAVPANPAHIGIPDSNNTKALPNKSTAMKISLIAGFPFQNA